MRFFKNPNITIEIIEKYLDKPLDWENISSNKFSVQNRINYFNFLSKNLKMCDDVIGLI